eukprot:3135244-Amphidinium_carterae.1
MSQNRCPVVSTQFLELLFWGPQMIHDSFLNTCQLCTWLTSSRGYAFSWPPGGPELHSQPPITHRSKSPFLTLQILFCLRLFLLDF